MKFRSILLASFFLTSLFFGCGKKENKTYVKIGTGSQVGIYYSAGLELAKLTNESGAGKKFDVAVESTSGSVFNINSVATGYLEFGFAQADRQYQAFYGKGIWEANPQDNLRFICSFHPEIVTLVASEDSGIQVIADLKGKKVSLGSYGSGTRGNALDILYANHLVEDEDYDAEALKPGEASLMLQDSRIDAFFYTVGHPNGSISEATNGKRPVRLIDITGVDQLIAANPYYQKTFIPQSYYPRSANTRDIESVGMLTTLLTSKDVSEELVYQLTKSLFENLDTFSKKHPAFEMLRREKMVEGGFAPLHPGAKKYYEEVGLL